MEEWMFVDLYWKQYVLIEKEFRATAKYVALNKDNYNTYSDEYTKLLLEIGSEVDVVAKKLCQEINGSSSADSIKKYHKEISAHFSDFERVKVECFSGDLFPWKGWSDESPLWWKIYNGIKHNRNSIATYGFKTNDTYKFANQGVVLNALSGLYQLEQYLYTLIQHDPHVETPLPGSRLFRLASHGWETKQYGLDSILYTEEGRLIYLSSNWGYADA